VKKKMNNEPANTTSLSPENKPTESPVTPQVQDGVPTPPASSTPPTAPETTPNPEAPANPEAAPPTSKTPPGPPEPESAETKEQALQQKKKKFLVISAIASFIILAGLIGGAILYINKQKEGTNGEEPKDTGTIQETPKAKWLDHNDENLRLSVKYPENTTLNITKSSLQVAFDEESDSSFKVTITPLDLPGRTLDDVVGVKRESYYSSCPSGVQITNALPVVVGGDANGKVFEVKNCDGDYKVTYAPRFEKFYEISQYHKGDFGYVQNYRLTTNEVVESLVLYPEEEIPETDYKTWTSEKHKVQFSYPKELALDCCEIPAPPDDVNALVTLGVERGGLMGGFRVFAKDAYQVKDKTLDEYAEDQKQKLISDYRVAKGTDPVVTEERIKVGSSDAIRFRGLSWKGNDLIYTEIPNEYRRGEILIISVENTMGQEFEDIMDGVLTSFEYL
jgi:hypothetical protein